MDGPHAIIAVVFVALVLTGGAIAVQHASQTTADKHAPNVTAQSGSPGEIVTLDNSSVDGAYYSDTATVTNESSGAQLDGNGTDYTWYTDNGTLRVDSQDAANATLHVDYEYWTRTETQIETTGVVNSIIQSGAWIPLVLVIALLLVGLTALGGLS